MATPKRRKVIPKSRTKKPAAKKAPRRRVTPVSKAKKPSTPSRARQAPKSSGGDFNDVPQEFLESNQALQKLKGRDSIRGRGPGGMYNPTLQEQLSNLTTDYREVAQYAKANPSDKYGLNKLADYANRVATLQQQIQKSSGGRYGFKPSPPPMLPPPMPTTPIKIGSPVSGAIQNQGDFMNAYNSLKNKFTPNQFINTITKPTPRRRITPVNGLFRKP